MYIILIRIICVLNKILFVNRNKIVIKIYLVSFISIRDDQSSFRIYYFYSVIIASFDKLLMNETADLKTLKAHLLDLFCLYSSDHHRRQHVSTLS